MPTVYFDHNATTPIDGVVLEAMADCERRLFANPSSIHRLGRDARAALDEARERVAACWKCRATEIVFTSSATEANNLAVFGAARARRGRGRHLITSAIEHPAVLAAFQQLSCQEGFALTIVPPTPTGRIAVDRVAAALRPDTVLVSIMAANNEIGTVQPVAELGALCRTRGVLFHTDAVQWFGKLPCASVHEFNADLVSACAHKFHGPKGVGALFVKAGFVPEPLLFGGGQENDRRAGTENLAAIVGFSLALERFTQPPVFGSPELRSLAERLWQAAATWPGVFPLGLEVNDLPNTVALAVEHADGAALVAALDLEGICASSGSACSAGSLTPSHVLLALNPEPAAPRSLLRFSLGRASTAAEVQFVISRTPSLIERVRGGERPYDSL